MNTERKRKSSFPVAFGKSPLRSFTPQLPLMWLLSSCQSHQVCCPEGGERENPPADVKTMRCNINLELLTLGVLLIQRARMMRNRASKETFPSHDSFPWFLPEPTPRDKQRRQISLKLKTPE